MSYASDALIDALKRENNQLKDENARLRQELEAVGTAAYLYGRNDLADENAKLREMATHALRHIIEFECEADNREQFQGKPCEWCVYHGSSDCPKIIAVMYGELEIEVPE